MMRAPDATMRVAVSVDTTDALAIIHALTALARFVPQLTDAERADYAAAVAACQSRLNATEVPT